jgi:hypothetical protein
MKVIHPHVQWVALHQEQIVCAGTKGREEGEDDSRS